MCIVAHPNATDYSWTTKELKNLSSLYDAIEVYNGGTSKWKKEQYARAFDKWDVLLNGTVSPFATCGDDYTPSTVNVIDIDRACVVAVVDLPVGANPTREDVLSALKSGCFYSSYGLSAHLAPKITGWWYDGADGRVKLTVENPEGLEFRFVSNDPAFTTRWETFPKTGPASTNLRSFGSKVLRWIRAEVRSTITTRPWMGRTSFTQPIWFVPNEREAKTFPPLSGSSLKQEGTPIELNVGDALLLFPTRPSEFEEVNGDIMGMDERPRKCPPLGYMSECYRFLPDDKELPKGTTLTIKYEPHRVFVIEPVGFGAKGRI